MYKDIECPYCEHEFDICNDDGYGCDPSKLYEEECPECEKKFYFRSEVRLEYEAQPSCRETGECQFCTNYSWDEIKKQQHKFEQCEMCGQKRELETS